jgi:hypothetical protein
MKKFSIDLKASAKGERKKVVKYLRAKGFSVTRKRDAPIESTSGELNYLCSYTVKPRHQNNDFNYYKGNSGSRVTLTLPQDWSKLIDIIEEDTEYFPGIVNLACETILHSTLDEKIKELEQTAKDMLKEIRALRP